MDSRPDVSVIIPCFNSSSTIQRAITSVLDQEGVNTEIILVDDGSTDNSVKQAESIAGDRITVQHLAGPSGTGKARNKGIEISTGTWVQFLDADDSLEPGKLKKQLEVSDNADIVISGWNLYSNDQLVEKQFPHKLADVHDKLEVLLKENKIHSGSPLIRRNLVEKIGGFNEELYHEDWEFWINLFASKPRIAFLPGFLSNYFRSTASKSWDTRKRLIEDIRLLEYLQNQREYEAYRQTIQTELRKKRVDTYVAYWVAGEKVEANKQLVQLEDLKPAERAVVLLTRTGLASRLISGGLGPKKLMRTLAGFIERSRLRKNTR